MRNSVHLARGSLLLALALACAAPAAAAVAPLYTLTDLAGTRPGYVGSFGEDINSLGDVAGSLWAGAANYKPFRYGDGSLTPLAYAPNSNYYNIATGINVHGDVVGYAGGQGQGPATAILWAADGSTSALGTLGGYESVAWGVNDAGQITGWSHPAGSSGFHAYRYESGNMTDLGTLGGAASQGLDINQAGDVAGYSQITGSANYHPFVYRGGVMTDLGTLGGAQAYASALNDVGQVAGDSMVTGSTNRHAFLHANGVMTDLGTLGGANSYGGGINNAGDVVGFSDIAGSGTHAFLYSNGAMHDLNDLIAPTPGWVLYRARAINDAGQITGFARVNGYERAFLLTPVPEAGTSALMLAGLAMLGGLARRRRR